MSALVMTEEKTTEEVVLRLRAVYDAAPEEEYGEINRDLASFVGCSESTIWRWRTGAFSPSGPAKRMLAMYLPTLELRYKKPEPPEKKS